MIGWDCRIRNVKQKPWKPTKRRTTPGEDLVLPGPGHYDPPKVYCGKGFSHIKRAPAYSFGLPTNRLTKPQVNLTAPQLNIEYLTRKGTYRIPQGHIAELCFPSDYGSKIPGPGHYTPMDLAQKKKPPAYSLRPAAKPFKEPWDMWTPSPNMYLPPIYVTARAPPAFSLGPAVRHRPKQQMPGPGDHDPNFDYVKKTKPAFSMGARLKKPTTSYTSPAPNQYCEKRFNYIQRMGTAPSFGIRHSPYVNKQVPCLKPSDLKIGNV